MEELCDSWNIKMNFSALRHKKENGHVKAENKLMFGTLKKQLEWAKESLPVELLLVL